jgi:colanic acid/amylovoran biosynthesis glycosyltransferase
MKTAYITVQTPYGSREQFILPEIIEFVNSGNEVVVLPLRPDKKLFEGQEPSTVSKYTLAIPLHSPGVVILGISIFLRRPFRSMGLLSTIVSNSGSLKKVFKNLAVLAKGLTLSEVVKRREVEHIHAHWASTSATAAYIASYMSGIPWSFTCHRWDIAENNMLKEKVRSAKFVRVINDNGYNEVINIAGDEIKDKCIKLHVGINISPEAPKLKKHKDKFTIAVPANLVEVKGHIYLIDAIKLLADKGYSVLCNFYGEGTMKETLKNKVNELNLNKDIIFNDKLAHDELLAKYENGEFDCVILPSIVTATEKEGIPVSLMEAMAYKIPVVSTNTGGIPELLKDEAGILVAEKNPQELANGIIRLIEDRTYYEGIAQKGYNRVYEEFYLPNIVEELVKLMN